MPLNRELKSHTGGKRGLGVQPAQGTLGEPESLFETVFLQILECSTEMRWSLIPFRPDPSPGPP